MRGWKVNRRRLAKAVERVCGQVLGASAHRGMVEVLEVRRLLTVTPAEYATIRSAYADFGLPADMGSINIIEITPDQLSVTNLKSAIATAGSTAKQDLVVLRTSNTQNTISYTSAADELAIDIPAVQGSVSIIGFGTQPLTLNASRYSRVASIGGHNSTTMVNLGGMTLTGGMSPVLGGGIFLLDGTLHVTNATITGNTTSGMGGGIHQNCGTSVLTNVTLSGNTADEEGGGAWLFYADATFRNVSVIGNSTSASSGSGGGLSGSHGRLAVVNTTISGNSASYSGGGVWLSGSDAVVTMYNSIIARNTAAYGNDVRTSDDWTLGGSLSAANNLIGDGSGQSLLLHGVDGNRVGTYSTPIDPAFIKLSGSDWSGWDLRPRVGSPVINAGRNTWLPAGLTTDMVGVPRILDSVVDLGAYETMDSVSLVCPRMPANEGAVQTFSLLSVVPSLISGWTIDWGDGHVEAITGSPASVQHTYDDGPLAANVVAVAHTAAGDLQARVDGSALALDSHFNQQGTIPGSITGLAGSIYAMAEMADGRFLITTAENAGTHWTLYRYNADGTPDLAFGSGGKASTNVTYGWSAVPKRIVVRPDGRILVAGDASSNNQWVFANYNSDGTPDMAAGTSGIVYVLNTPAGHFQTVALDTVGHILVCNGVYVYRLQSTLIPGSQFGVPDAAYCQIDTSFGVGGVADTGFKVDTDIRTNPRGIVPSGRMEVMPDGRIVVAGMYQQHSALARFTADGQRDAMFGAGGLAVLAATPESALRGLVIQADGSILASGLVMTSGGVLNTLLIRCLPNGTLDTAFGTGGITVTIPMAGSYDNGPSHIEVGDDGRIRVTGLSLPASGDLFAPTCRLFVLTYRPAGDLDTSAADGGMIWSAPIPYDSSSLRSLHTLDGAILFAPKADRVVRYVPGESVLNVAPTAVFTGSMVVAGSPATVSFSPMSDASVSDIQAGFHYDYDLDGDGVYEIRSVTSATYTVPASKLTTVGVHAVHGRIYDKDGGAREYTTTVTVQKLNHVPSATVSLNSHSPTTNDDLIATATKTDSDGDSISLTFVWKVDGVIRRTFTSATALTDSFDLSVAGDGDKGQTVTVEATPNDGTLDGLVASDSAVVVNTAPGVGGMARSVTLGTTLGFAAGDFMAPGAFSDVDGDGLQSVRITALPEHGTLTLNGVAVAVNQRIAVGQLGGLTYIPQGYVGSDSFGWTASDGTDEAAAPAVVSLTVTKAAPGVTVTSSKGSSTYGEQVTFTATVSGAVGVPTGSVQFLVDGQAIGVPVTVGADGTATYRTSALVAGDHSITASYRGDLLYQASSGSIGQLVARAALNIVVDSQTITYGQAISELTGVVTGLVAVDGVSVSYSTTATSHSDAGAYDIVATLSGSNANCYAVTNPPGVLTINKARQAITWANPAAITPGTALGEEQLNAVVSGIPGGSEPGALSYDPAAGTVLASGCYTLTVSAAETANYELASASVTLVVEYAPTGIALSSASVAENRPAGTEVGVLSTSDPDDAGGFSYTIVAVDGQSGSDLFVLDDNVLEANAAFDHELKSSYVVRICSTDPLGQGIEQDLTVTVGDVAEDVVVTGTSGDDRITAELVNGMLRCWTNGSYIEHDPAMVQSLTISGGAGDDTITLGQGVPAARVEGGEGDDHILTSESSGTDTVLGGAGRDYLHTKAGDQVQQDGSDLRGRFGLVDGKSTKLVLSDADGDQVIFALTGGGTGQVYGPGFEQLVLSGTTGKSILSIGVRKARGGDGVVQLGRIVADGLLKSLSASGVFVTGDVVLNQLDQSGGTLNSLRLGGITNGSISSVDLPIGSMSLLEWHSDAGIHSALSAPWVGSLAVRGRAASRVLPGLAGDLQADVRLSAADSRGRSLRGLSVVGSVSGVVLQASQGSIGTLAVRGALASSRVAAGGGIGAVSVGMLADSEVLVGVRSDLQGRSVTSSSDFVNPAAKLGSLTVRGGRDKAVAYTRNSQISAGVIGKVSLVNCDGQSQPTQIHTLREGRNPGKVTYTDKANRANSWSYSVVRPAAGQGDVVLFVD